MKNDQPSLDKERVRATFNKAASRYENFDFLQREVANRLLQRLDANTNDAKMILELGCGTGRMIPSLQRKFAKSRLFCIDIAEAMLIVAKKPIRLCLKKRNFLFVLMQKICPLNKARSI